MPATTKTTFLCLICLVFAAKLDAQNFAPVATGNYSGIHGAKLNPALPAHMKYTWHVNLVGGWVNFNNNYVSSRLPFSGYRFINNKFPAQYTNTDGSLRFDTNWIREHLNGKSKHFAGGAMIYGPSFTIKIKKFSIGAVSEFTALGRLAGLDEKLAHAAFKGFDTARGAASLFNLSPNGTNTIHRTAMQYSSYLAIGINAAYSIPIKWNRTVIVGITPKKIWGYGGTYFHSDKITATTVNGDSVRLDKTNITFMDFTHSGKGSGVDLGGVYIFKRPEFKQPGEYGKNHTLYQYKFGFSLMDIGRVKYKDAEVTTIANNNPIGYNVEREKAKYQNQSVSVNSINTVIRDLPNYSQTVEDVKIGLPTRLVLFTDYMVKPRWFVNAQLVQSLRSRYKKNMRVQSYLAIAPRYERDWFEVSVPMSLMYDYRAFRMGAAFRVGPLYFGSNSLLSVFSTRRTRDYDFFIGLAFGNFPGKFKKRIEDNSDAARKAKEQKQKAKDCEKM